MKTFEHIDLTKIKGGAKLNHCIANFLGHGNIPAIYGRVFLFCLTFLVVCLTPGIFYAFSEADLARLLSTK